MNGNLSKVLIGLLVAVFMFFMGLAANALIHDVERLEYVVDKNSSAVASQQAQNAEILRRLDRIEKKLDQ